MNIKLITDSFNTFIRPEIPVQANMFCMLLSPILIQIHVTYFTIHVTYFAIHVTYLAIHDILLSSFLFLLVIVFQMQVLINEKHNTGNGNCSSDSAVPIDPQYQTVAQDDNIQEKNVHALQKQKPDIPTPYKPKQVIYNEECKTGGENCASDSAVPIDPKYQTVAQNNNIQEQNVHVLQKHKPDIPTPYKPKKVIYNEEYDVPLYSECQTIPHNNDTTEQNIHNSQKQRTNIPNQLLYNEDPDYKEIEPAYPTWKNDVQEPTHNSTTEPSGEDNNLSEISPYFSSTDQNETKYDNDQSLYSAPGNIDSNEFITNPVNEDDYYSTAISGPADMQPMQQYAQVQKNNTITELPEYAQVNKRKQ